MDNKSVKARIRRICKGWGITLKPLPFLDNFARGYEGNNVIIARKYKNREWDYSDTIHEIAHWLCASPERRKEINWGLGTSPDGFSSVRTYLKATEEEEEASLLGIAIERALGLNWEHTFSEHAWDQYLEDGNEIDLFSISKFDAIKRLRRRRLLSRFLLFSPSIVTMKGPKMLTFKQLQEEQKPWVEYNFPGREWWQPIFGIVEEIGEACHALLKRKQKIRGTDEEHLEKIKDAFADATIFMADACTALGIDYQEVMETTWAEVKTRNWIKYPKNGKSE